MSIRFRLILIYPYDRDGLVTSEYNEREFDSMGELLVYLNGVHVTNIHRVLIERI